MKIIANRRTLKFGNTVCIQGEQTEVSEVFRGIIVSRFAEEVTFVSEEVKVEDEQLEEENQEELEVGKTEEVDQEEDLLQDLKKNIDTTKKAEIKEILKSLDIEFDDELKTNELREFVKNLEA